MPKVGRGMPALCALALERLGGEATTSQLRTWVDCNKENASVVEILREGGVVLNHKVTLAKDRPEGTPTWHISVSACLSSCKVFTLTDEKIDGQRMWRMSSEDTAADVPSAKR